MITRGPLSYAGTKLGVILITARLGAPAIQRAMGEDHQINWVELIGLASYRVNKWEKERWGQSS